MSERDTFLSTTDRISKKKSNQIIDFIFQIQPKLNAQPLWTNWISTLPTSMSITTWRIKGFVSQTKVSFSSGFVLLMMFTSLLLMLKAMMTQLKLQLVDGLILSQYSDLLIKVQSKTQKVDLGCLMLPTDHFG